MSPVLEQPALTWLWNARIQRIDGPKPGLFALSLFHEGARSTLLLAVHPDERGVATVSERPKGEAASSFVQRLRRAIENGRLAQASWLGSEGQPERASALVLHFTRSGAKVTLVADFDRKAPTLLLLGAEEQIVGASDVKALKLRGLSFGKPYVALVGAQGIRIASDANALAAAGATLSEQRSESRLEQQRAQLRTQLRSALKRAERKVAAIEGDRARAALAPTLRRHASLILCNLAAIPRGTAQIALADESVDPPEIVELTLDPARDANANAQTMFERARKVERGTLIASERLRETKVELERLRELERVVHEAQQESELDGVGRALGKNATPAPQATTGKKRPKPQAHVPFHTFTSSGGARILVGKNAADNDTLTLTIARPHDHWLHVRGVQGSHVVVPVERGATLHPEVLIDAAHLAVHFSGMRGEPVAEVHHTERRYVRKPKGSAVGAVNVDREKVIRLRLEAERLARLLKT
jgi:predicted ribosome quality control (RQC) complex YloA/Tae2 family protein